MQSLYRTLQGLGISALNISGIDIEVTFPRKLFYSFKLPLYSTCLISTVDSQIVLPGMI